MSCPFCLIAAASPPAPSPTILTSPSGSSTYLALSTPLVVAFLDIAPVSRGHLLVCPRAHYGKSTEIPSLEAAAVGFWIPVLGRAVMRAVWGERGVEGSWNVVQANGAEAGQTVPHVHFHVIPRAGDEAMAASDMGDAERSNIALGEGPRERLEEEEGGVGCSDILSHQLPSFAFVTHSWKQTASDQEGIRYATMRPMSCIYVLSPASSTAYAGTSSPAFQKYFAPGCDAASLLCPLTPR